MDILSSAGKPEPNLVGVDFDCHTCRESVGEAFYDRQEKVIYYWCSKDHRSVLEEVSLDI